MPSRFPDTNTGFVVTLVPKSSLPPHQTVKPIQYYMRAGSTFAPVPHGVLAGLFGRAPQPDLFHNWVFEPPSFVPVGQAGISSIHFVAAIQLHNRGPGIARDLFVNVETWSIEHGASVKARPRLENWLHEESFGVLFASVSSVDFRLAPGGVTVPVTLEFDFDFRATFEQNLTMRITYGCGTCPPARLERIVEPAVLNQLFHRGTPPKGKELADALLPNAGARIASEEH